MIRPSPQELARLEHLAAKVEELRPHVPRLEVVFGQMRLRTAARETDVFLGALSRTAPDVSLIHWQTAPLAEVFFAYDEGDEYEVDLEDRSVTGTLLEKNVLTFADGALHRVETPTRAFELVDREWFVAERSERPHVPLRAGADRKPFRSPLEVQLDPAQQRIVDLPWNRNVLILGEAGFGKTTVALHRLAAMVQRARRGFRSAVVVPTEGLRRLTILMLERRGIDTVDVWTYEKFASAFAHKAFPDLPRKESEDASAGVQRVKRHPAVRDVLREYVRTRPKPPHEEEPRRHSKARARRVDLHHLFGDRALVDQVIAASAGTIGPQVAREVTEHTRIQFEDPAELAYAHVDKDSLTTVDGRSIDEATPMQDADTVDVEDYAVMFELERLRAQATGEKPLELGTYHCVIVDEAQEFAPLELALIGRTVQPGGSLVVAGDAAQQVDTTHAFTGWRAVMEELSAPDHERAVLEVNYRCPPEVTALARTLVEVHGAQLGPSRGTGAITRARHANDFQLAAWLTDELARITADDPSASVAVICRGAETARTLVRTLKHVNQAQLALDGDFRFQPGLTVTTVSEVKGLEFDYVILPDATPGAYPDSAESRRALYVAVTRATHRLVLATPNQWAQPVTLSEVEGQVQRG